jgi:branched-chain amino acid transport system ATP-binding protein
MAVLEARNISIVFGGLTAVSNFNLKLEKGILAGLIGPNGAGKTTVFNMLTGVYTPTSGNIAISNGSGEKIINKLKPYQITQLGVARTFQNIRLFKELTVLDNVRIAFHFKTKYNAIKAIIRTTDFYNEEDETTQKALELLKIFNLKNKANEKAKNLPYGEQRKLEITRALATNPKVLLLDEPAAGMNPQETQDLMHLIRFIRNKFDLTILLIEHDMSLVMGICEKITVLDYGQIIAVGNPDEVIKDPKVIKAYLGEEVDSNAES